MKFMPDRIRRLWQRTPRACVIVILLLLALAAGMIAVGRYAGAKYAGALTMVIVWFFHLAVGAGGAFAIMRLWYHRSNPLIRRMAIYMHAAPIMAVTSIVLIFMAKGVTLTWKFSITLFAGALVADLVRLPFILYMTRGDDPHASTVPEVVTKPPADPDMNAPS